MYRKIFLLICVVFFNQSLFSMSITSPQESSFLISDVVNLIVADLDLRSISVFLRTCSTQACMHGNGKRIKRKKMIYTIDRFLLNNREKCRLLNNQDYLIALERYAKKKDKIMFNHVLQHENNDNRQTRIELYSGLQAYHPQVQKLLAEGKEIILHSFAHDIKRRINRPIDGTLPLFSAILANDKDRVKNLIVLGANLNILYKEIRPLHLAVQQGDADMVSILVSYSVDTDALDVNGFTALQWASVLGKTDVYQQLAVFQS